MEEIELKKFILQTIGEDTNSIDFEDLENENTKKFNRTFYTEIKNSLSKHKWSFAVYKIKLQNRQELIDDQYKYSYDLPADFILLIKLDETSEFAVRDKLYCDSEQVSMLYIRNVDTLTFPVYFLEYIRYKIAFQICYYLTGDGELLKMLEAKSREEYLIASNTDSMFKKSMNINTSTFSGARFA